GAGSVGMANSAQLAASHRRTRLLQFRETLGQMGELLSGAEVMVKQRLQQSPHQQGQPRQLQLPSSQPPSPPQLPSPVQLPSSPQPQPRPQAQGQQGSQASVWGRLFSFGSSIGRSTGPHQSCSSASSRSLSRTDSCATVSSCGTIAFTTPALDAATAWAYVQARRACSRQRPSAATWQMSWRIFMICTSFRHRPSMSSAAGVR
ncbi:hypothetical protein Vretimale_17209, partial [Volvox reticuliferus]